MGLHKNEMPVKYESRHVNRLVNGLNIIILVFSYIYAIRKCTKNIIIYKKISEEMSKHGTTSSAKHVYQILKTNRGGMHDNVLRAFNITASEVSELRQSLDFSISEGKSVLPNQKQERKFNLVIPNHVWRELKSKKSYDDRRYIVLKQKKWTNTFAQKIYDQTRIECPFSFQRIKIFKSSDAKCYAKFEANCTECGKF